MCKAPTIQTVHLHPLTIQLSPLTRQIAMTVTAVTSLRQFREIMGSSYRCRPDDALFYIANPLSDLQGQGHHLRRLGSLV